MGEQVISIEDPSNRASMNTVEAVSNTYTSQKYDWLKYGFVSMILPQVHLRKPCYDFSFL